MSESYPRLGYDVDASLVMLTVGGVTTALTAPQLAAINNEAEDTLGSSVHGVLTLVFPYDRNLIDYMLATVDTGVGAPGNVEYSTDTTTGLDGTWTVIDPVATIGAATVYASWQTDLTAFSGTPICRGVRFALGSATSTSDVRALHIYARPSPLLDPATVRYLEVGPAAGLFNHDFGAVATDSPVAIPMHLATTYTGGVSTALGHTVITIESATDSAPSFAGQLLLSVDQVNWGATLAFDDMDATGHPVDLFWLLYVPPPGADPGHWVARIKAVATNPDWPPVVNYVFVDSTAATEPQALYVASVTPAVGVVADSTVVTVEGFGLIDTDGSPRDGLVLLDAAGVATPLPDDAVATRIAATVGAYTGARVVSSVAIDPAHDQLVFTAPLSLAGAANPVAMSAFGPAVVPGGAGAFTVLATLATPAGAPGTNTSAAGAVLIRTAGPPDVVDLTVHGFSVDDLPDPVLYPATFMPQRRLARTRAPYAVVDGEPVDPPVLGAMSRSVAYARSFSATMDLASQLSLGSLGLTARWLADTADITGGDHWNPHFGAAPAFVFSALAAAPPYVDPDYEYYARYEKLKTVQAMVFDGTSWARFGGPNVQVAFGWFIVAVLHHPAGRASYDLLAAPSAATDPDKATDACLRYDNGHLRSFGNARLSSHLMHPPSYKGRIRPVIIVWSESAHGGILGVVDGLGRHWQTYAHPNRASYDLRMFLGMDGGTEDARFAAEMDVLEIGYTDHRLTVASAKPVVHRLDGVYGVTGR